MVVDQVVQAGSFGVQSHRLGALERVGWVLADWDAARANRAVVEQRMVGVLDELDLTNVVCTIPGLSGTFTGKAPHRCGSAPPGRVAGHLRDPAQQPGLTQNASR